LSEDPNELYLTQTKYKHVLVYFSFHEVFFSNSVEHSNEYNCLTDVVNLHHSPSV